MSQTRQRQPRLHLGQSDSRCEITCPLQFNRGGMSRLRGGAMSTKITELVTVCLPFGKVKLYGTWYQLDSAVAREVEELRKHPLVWVYIKNHSCRECDLAKECVCLETLN